MRIFFFTNAIISSRYLWYKSLFWGFLKLKCNINIIVILAMNLVYYLSSSINYSCIYVHTVHKQRHFQKGNPKVGTVLFCCLCPLTC